MASPTLVTAARGLTEEFTEVPRGEMSSVHTHDRKFDCQETPVLFSHSSTIREGPAMSAGESGRPGGAREAALTVPLPLLISEPEFDRSAARRGWSLYTRLDEIWDKQILNVEWSRDP